MEFLGISIKKELVNPVPTVWELMRQGPPMSQGLFFLKFNQIEREARQKRAEILKDWKPKYRIVITKQ